MSTKDRRERERTTRRALITATARTVAEREGWEAVTTRRLATEIEYSQPVIYQHFASMEAVEAAVALDGFTELGGALATARAAAGSAREAVAAVARAYGSYAQANPAVYDAMFRRATGLRFASDDVPAPLSAGFDELRHALAASGVREDDVETETEVFWAALHGLAALHRAGRLRPEQDAARRQQLVERFAGR